jgi:cutinase
MRPSLVVFAVAGLTPTVSATLEKRQSTLNELSGACRKVIFVWARASTEPGNMVSKGNNNDTPPTNTQIGHVNGPNRLQGT